MEDNLRHTRPGDTWTVPRRYHLSVTRRGSRYASLTGVALLALAPLATPQVERFQQSWRWVEFTDLDGLPSDAVTCVTEANGVPWVGTSSGLAWYDGWSWRQPSGTSEIAERAVHQVAVDPRGEAIWALADGQLFRGDEDEIRRVAISMDGAEIQSFAWCEEGLFFTTFEEGFSNRHRLFRLAGTEVLEVPWPGQGTDVLGGLATHGRGQAWLKTDQGLYLRESGAWRDVLEVEVEPWVGTVDVASNGDQALMGVMFPPEASGVWERAGQGAFERNDAEGRDLLRCADVGPDGRALAIYESGEVRFRQDGEWAAVDPVSPMLRNATTCSFRDNGDIWVGTGRGLFLFKYSSERWTQWKRGRGERLKNRVHEILVATDGSVWIASAGGIERRVDGQLAEVSQPDGESHHEVTGIGESADGRIWISSGSTFAGLYVWDGARWDHEAVDAVGLSLGLIHKVRRDARDHLWFVSLASSLGNNLTYSGGVHRLADGRIEFWEPVRQLGDVRVYDILEARDGAHWIATSRGAARWDGDEWEVWDEGAGLASNTVARLVEDPAGGVWVANDYWLAHIDGAGNVTSEALGASSEHGRVMDMAFDAAGRLWVTGWGGLFCRAEGVWSSFDTAVGLADERLWPVTVVEDQLYLGTVGGGTYILDSTHDDVPPPRVRLGAPVRDRDRSLLRWRPESWWGDQPTSAIETRYRFDSGEWSEWSRDREIELAGLQPHGHLFEVQAKGLFGELGEPAVVEFDMTGPLFGNPAFYVPIAAMALALVGLVVVGVRRKRRHAAALRTSEEQHRQLMEQASDAILIFDAEGRCIQANSRAEEVFARRREEICRLDWATLLPERRAASPDAAWQSIRAGSELVMEFAVRRPSGEVVPAEGSAKALRDGRVVAILRDLTERRRLEEERRAFERSLTEAQKLESLGQMAGGVAHDFNNLLMAMRSSADHALYMVDRESEAAESLGNIVTGIERAGELTTQLLAYSGRESLSTQLVDLNQLVSEMGSLLRASISRRIEIEYHLQEPLPRVEGDAGRLRQVLLNLIVNGADSIGSDQGKIVVTTGPASADDGGVATQVFVRVADTGAGIPNSIRSRIFDPFFTTKDRGRGLGLAAVHGILRSHGGRIEVESTAGEGAVFTVWLPAAVGTDTRNGHEDPEDRVPLQGTGRILLVDDEKSIRRALSRVLGDLGFEVVTAESGERGLQLFLEQSDDIVCTLVDMTMPGESGLDVLDQIREHRSSAPVLLMSGYAEVPWKKGQGDEPTEFLQKPFSTEDLETVLRRLIASE